MRLAHWQQVEHIDQLTPGLAVQVRQRWPFYTICTSGTVREIRYWTQDYIMGTGSVSPGSRVYVHGADVIIEDTHGEAIYPFPQLDQCYISGV